MNITLTEIGALVYCTDAEANGNPDPRTHTNVIGGVAFCNYCGDTDHEQVTP